jgi:ATP-dependent DNA helicase RecG
MDILQLLSLPEGKTLEFKRDLSSPKPVLRTLVAFANTAGGTLIIGRADDGKLVGVNDVLAEEERLASLIADSIAPAMMPEIEAISVEDKTLLLVRVAHWPGPFYLKELGAADGVYVRLGSTNRKADAAMLAELERFRSNHSFDQLPCGEAGKEALDDALIRRWFETIGKAVRTSDLESMEILVPHGSRKVVSNGGMILFGREEVRNRHFPDANVSCALFHGTTKSRFLDRKDMGGGILGALEEVPKFIARIRAWRRRPRIFVGRTSRSIRWWLCVKSSSMPWRTPITALPVCACSYPSFPTGWRYRTPACCLLA